jgi:uncharacterized protein YneF (UPF0154 family)
MKPEAKQEIEYDRINTRYNRLWEQITNISLVIITVITGYLIALKTIEKNISSILTLTQVNYILLFMFILVLIPLVIFVGYLFWTRKELTRFLSKHDIQI